MLFLFAIFLLSAFCINAVSFQAHLRKSASSTPSKFIVDFSLTNTGEEFRFLRYGTPFDLSPDGRLLSDIFVVASDSANASYSGILAKRAITEGSFITLVAGATSTISIDLLKSYSFPSEGVYDVVVDTTIQIQSPSQDTLPLVAPEVPQFMATRAVVKHPQAQRQLQNVGTMTFTGCSDAQKDIVNTAVVLAYSMVIRDITYLSNPCIVLPVRKTYFGVCNPALAANLQSHFSLIHDLIESGFGIDCTGNNCGNGGVFAFVSPSDPDHVVHLCDQFWPANVSECAIDSQAGTLIHELSHFLDTAGTKDWVYGNSGAMALAKSSPIQAVNNADNHEYFSEACPTVPTFRQGYIGCALDKPIRDMNGPFENLQMMTTEMCHEYCAGVGSTHFALQAGTYCFCGDSYGSYGMVGDENCIYPTGGNKNQAGGGSYRNAVYSVAGSAPLTPPVGPSGYIGCYKDVASNRALSGNRQSKNSTTIESCRTFCRSGSQQWSYYGLQGPLCFCGNSYNSYGVGAGCATKCPGNSNEICGGILRNSVYAYN